MKRRIIWYVSAVTLVLSAVSWIYRFIDDNVPWYAIAFYVLVPLIAWLLFFGPLLFLSSERKVLRVIAAFLLVATGPLWTISVLIGFFGLRIH